MRRDEQFCQASRCMTGLCGGNLSHASTDNPTLKDAEEEEDAIAAVNSTT